MTDAERAALKRLIAAWRSGKLTTVGRSATSPGIDTVHELAPEVYVARTDARGIPALSAGSNTTTGTAGLSDDAPGYTDDVPVWRLDDLHADTPTMYPYDVGVTKRVFNLSTTAVPPDTWVLVKRDKSGAWWAEVGGGGSLAVCGNPDPLVNHSDASGTGTEKAHGCPTRTDHELLHPGVTQIKFAQECFQVSSGGTCGRADDDHSGTGTGTELSDGKVTVRTVGYTGQFAVGRGDPLFCDVTCTVSETERHLCYVDGLLYGYYDGVTANCGS